MNWKLKLLLWFVNNVQPLRKVDLKYIDTERKNVIRASKLGNVLFNSKMDVAEVKDFMIDDIPVRLYRNSNKPNQPIIVYFHGGGFVLYDVNSHDNNTRRLCAMNDCTVISVEYKLAPEHTFPAAQEDGFKVIEYLYKNATKLNIDATKIVVCGDSAGATISACIAHHYKNHDKIKLAAQVLIYPWVDGKIESASIEKYKEGYLLDKEAIIWFQQTYTPNVEDRLKPTCSPTYHKDFSNLAPAFIITAEYDPLKDEGYIYHKKLSEAGNISVYKDYKNLVHGFFNFPGVDKEVMQCYYDIQAFLKKVL